MRSVSSLAILQEETLSRLSSLTYLHCWTCWLWTSTEHDEDRHYLVTIVMAARGCTVSLGCSRRLDHSVIKMDLLPSFSQPNVREQQPLNIECSQFHCYSFSNITYGNSLGESRLRRTIFGANYSQKHFWKGLCYFKASGDMRSSSEMDASKQHTSKIFHFPFIH